MEEVTGEDGEEVEEEEVLLQMQVVMKRRPQNQLGPQNQLEPQKTWTNPLNAHRIRQRRSRKTQRRKKGEWKRSQGTQRGCSLKRGT